MTNNLMYTFVGNERPNPIGGDCYNCIYCYIHGKKGMKIRFKHIRDKYSGEFKVYDKLMDRVKNIRSDKPVFVCDCIDCMHENMPKEIILELLWNIEHNRYKTIFILLTKNPYRFIEFINYIPDNVILGVTIESNWNYPSITDAPNQLDRINQTIKLREVLTFMNKKNKIFISIEPVMKFHLVVFIKQIFKIIPDFGVAIGYDSKHHKLDEPELKYTLSLRNNLLIAGITVYDKLLRKAHWEK